MSNTIRPVPVPSAVAKWRRPGLRKFFLAGIVAVALVGAAMFIYLAYKNDESQKDEETAKAQATANCRTIHQLGGICPAELDEIRRGQQPPPPYTDAQVTKIVNEALQQFQRDNPDAVGISEAKALEIVQNYVATHPTSGRLPSDDAVRALIRGIIAADPSLRGPAGVNGADGKDGTPGARGPEGPAGPAGKDGTTTCPVGYHFEERRSDELVCVKDASEPPETPQGDTPS